eukprot:9435074-Karenia_brevis.AAC.1
MPRLYTSKSENTSLYYARPREYPFDTRSDFGVFGVQNTAVYKTFQIVMGVASKVPSPHHGGKVQRSNWAKNKYVHVVDQYYPLWIRFTCVKGTKIDQREFLTHLGSQQEDSSRKATANLMKSYQRRLNIAKPFIWDTLNIGNFNE